MPNYRAFLICIQIANSYAQSFSTEEVKVIDNAVQALRECKNIPGLGISLVRNGSVLYKGYGNARLDPPVAFDEFTVSNIGSTGKAFTTALLGVLITESQQKGGSLGWNSKIVDILDSNFQMSPNFVASEMSIKDLLTHRTGFMNTDLSLITMPANITRENYASRLKYLPQAQPFRDVWSYNNFMYMIAGHVAEVIGGKKFEELIKEKIWDPLGMNASIFLDDVSSRDDHFANPYFKVNETLSFNEDDFLLYRLGEFSPAGGLCSSPKDLSKWLLFLLGNGTTEDGLTLIDKTVFDEMFEPHVSLPRKVMTRYSVERPFPVVSLTAWYGYAWLGRNYRGYKSVFHTGSLHAYSTIASLYPQSKSGFFMMVNGPWPIKFRKDLEPLSYILSDILLQEDPWLNASTICTFPEPWEEQPSAKNQTETEMPADDYDATPCIGNYGHRIYGDITINYFVNESLSFKLNSVGFGNLTLLFSENSTFRIDFGGRLSLVFGANCEARFDEQSEGLFQLLHLKCAGEYEFQRGVSFVGEYGNSSSSGISNVFSLLFMFLCIVLLRFVNE